MSSIDGIVNSMGWAAQVSAPAQTTPASAATPTTSSSSFAGVFARAFRHNLDTLFVRSEPHIDADGDTQSPSLGAAVIAGGMGADAVAQRRALVGERLAASVSRLSSITVTLDSEYPLADLLASASTGTWDPATFQPRSEQEAQAFAERMAIDMTEAAARLDIVKNELDIARLDAQASPTIAAQAKVTELTRIATRQMQYLAKLAHIVDTASGGSVADVGEAALSGSTSRVFTDVSTKELAHEMRRVGYSTRDIERMLGAGEMSIGEGRTPGGDPRLRQATDQLTSTLITRFIMQSQQRRDDMARDAQTHERRMDDMERRADERAQQRRDSEAKSQEAADQSRQDLAAAAAEHQKRMEQLRTH